MSEALRPGEQSVKSGSRLAKACMLAPITLYRWTISPLLGVNCRHLPSCSDYASEAIDKNGAWRGGWLAFSRLCRCHPWGSHGFDPVPDLRAEHHRFALNKQNIRLTGPPQYARPAQRRAHQTERRARPLRALVKRAKQPRIEKRVHSHRDALFSQRLYELGHAIARRGSFNRIGGER